MRDLTYQQYYNMRGDEFRDGDRISVKLVCVLGHGDDYAVYKGTTDQTDEEIAEGGDKVYGDEIGKALFLTAVHARRYRR